MNDNPTLDNLDREPTREDVLIGRVVDHEASSGDWESLERLAEKDAGVWERLGRAQRVHARLEREVEDEIAIAELIDLPRREIAGYSLAGRFRQYAGWAVAAVLAVAFVGSFGLHRQFGSIPPGAGQAATTIPVSFTSPDEALQAYYRSGREKGLVLGEMPAVLIDARPIAGGNEKEVIFVRQIAERRILTDLSVLSVEVTEDGRSLAVPVQVREIVPTQTGGEPL